MPPPAICFFATETATLASRYCSSSTSARRFPASMLASIFCACAILAASVVAGVAGVVARRREAPYEQRGDKRQSDDSRAP